MWREASKLLAFTTQELLRVAQMIFYHTVGRENVALTPKYVASQGKPFTSCPGALRILNTILGF